MEVKVENPEPKGVKWEEVKAGEIFTWGSGGDHFIKINDESAVSVGAYYGILSKFHMDSLMSNSRDIRIAKSVTITY